jgi:cytochrome c biogenesis protein CcdA
LRGAPSPGLGGWASYAIAVVLIAMGLHLLGWLKLPLPVISGGVTANGVLGAFASGLLLSLVRAPCGTPVLASVPSFAAYKQSCRGIGRAQKQDVLAGEYRRERAVDRVLCARGTCS